MSNTRYVYLLYPLAVGICLAWAVTGFIRYGVSAPQADVRPSADMRRAGDGRPDTGLIRQKNIFHADTSAVKNTLDAVGFTPSFNPGQTLETGMTSAPSGMRLTGILKNPYLSYAIISMNNETVVLKQNVENKGLTLKKAYSDHVEIARGASPVTLYLDSSKNSAVSRAAAPVPPNTDRRSISRKDLVTNLSNVNSVMKAVQISPYERSGRFVGYRLTRLRPDSALFRLGLLSGDVIMRLNGKQLKDPAVFFDALANSENLSALTMDIERNKAKKTLYVEIK